MSLPHQSLADLITATIWNDQVDAINGKQETRSTASQSTTGTTTALTLPSGAGDLVIFLTNATLRTIQGITAGADGQRLTLISKGAGQVDLVHQSGSATAANRLVNKATALNTSLAPGSGSASYIYNSTTSRWELDHHEQGAYIAFTPTLTGSGGGTPNVYATQVGGYRLAGRTIFFEATVQLSTKNTITSNVRLDGLPGAITSTASRIPSASVSFWQNLTNSFIWIGAWGVTSTTQFEFSARASAGTAVAALATGDLSNTSEFVIGGSYETT